MSSASQFRIKQVVWAKVRGYPWWPAQVCSIEDVTFERPIVVNFIGHISHASLKANECEDFLENYLRHFSSKSRKLYSSIMSARRIAEGKTTFQDEMKEGGNKSIKKDKGDLTIFENKTPTKKQLKNEKNLEYPKNQIIPDKKKVTDTSMNIEIDGTNPNVNPNINVNINSNINPNASPNINPNINPNMSQNVNTNQSLNLKGNGNLSNSGKISNQILQIEKKAKSVVKSEQNNSNKESSMINIKRSTNPTSFQNESQSENLNERGNIDIKIKKLNREISSNIDKNVNDEKLSDIGS